MSRTKKSRKPGNAPTSANKEDKKKKVESSEIRFKKSHGKAPGNRQQEALKPMKVNAAATVKKDPRIGSKTPILLIKPAVKEKQPKATQTPMAEIRKVDTQQANLDELHTIEDDIKIQAILQKQEQALTLTEPEIEYFNEKMDRHSALSEKLGLTDDKPASDQGAKSALDEYALWDKLDASDFSDVE